MIRIRRRGRFAAAVVIGFVAAGLVALTATGAVRVLGLPTYTGPESKYPKTYPTPTKKPGFKCTIGFLNPLAANEFLISLQHGIEAESKKLGCSAVSKDAQLNVDKQVTEFNDLIAQKVSAIIVFPNDPKALDPSIAKAKRAGIPVIGIVPLFGTKR